MQSSLPDWAQWIQALGPVVTAGATVIIGGLVAFIAWGQWKTAREKLVLDLHEKRFKVFMLLRRIVSELTQLGKLGDPGALNELVAEGRFLFGPEITRDLEEVHRLGVAIEVKDVGAKRELDGVYSRLLTALEPYLAMRQHL